MGDAAEREGERERERERAEKVRDREYESREGCVRETLVRRMAGPLEAAVRSRDM